MTSIFFAEENDFKNNYQRFGLKDVLRSVDRELEDIQSMTLTVSQSLERQSMTPHDARVAAIAGNRAFELQHKIKLLAEHLASVGTPALWEVPNGR